LVSPTTRSTVWAGKRAMREGRVLSRVSPATPASHEALLPAPDRPLVFADRPHDGEGAGTFAGQQNDLRSSSVRGYPPAGSSPFLLVTACH